jgi:hypothetical protein
MRRADHRSGCISAGARRAQPIAQLRSAFEENFLGDRLRRQEGAEVEQVGSGGAGRLHLREGEREGGADRGVVAEGAATREELRSLRLVEFQVLGRADRTLDDVGPGLVQGQWQTRVPGTPYLTLDVGLRGRKQGRS